MQPLFWDVPAHQACGQKHPRQQERQQQSPPPPCSGPVSPARDASPPVAGGAVLSHTPWIAVQNLPFRSTEQVRTIVCRLLGSSGIRVRDVKVRMRSAPAAGALQPTVMVRLHDPRDIPRAAKMLSEAKIPPGAVQQNLHWCQQPAAAAAAAAEGAGTAAGPGAHLRQGQAHAQRRRANYGHDGGGDDAHGWDGLGQLQQNGTAARPSGTRPMSPSPPRAHPSREPGAVQGSAFSSVL
jgi:hypothetical protein